MAARFSAQGGPMKPTGTGRFRRALWLWGSAGLVLGLLLSALWWRDMLVQTWALWEELEHLQAQVLPQPPAADRVVPPLHPHTTAPTPRESDAAWHWLRLRLQAHGLRIESWQAEPVQATTVLHSQLATLRVQGAWADWLAFCQQLVAHAPWWRWERWLVQPAGADAAAGQVLVDAQWRLWLLPEPEGETAYARNWPQWPVTLAREPTRLFMQTELAQAPTNPEPKEPGGWRLWGVWTQAGQLHAVLGRGSEWTVLSPGQVLAPDGWRLERITAQGVDLQPTRAGGALLRLPWPGGAP